MTFDEVMAKLAQLEERVQTIEKRIEEPPKIAISNVPYHVHRYDDTGSHEVKKTGGPESF